MNDLLQALLETDREFSRIPVEPGTAKNFLSDDALWLPNRLEPVKGANRIYEILNSSAPGNIFDW